MIYTGDDRLRHKVVRRDTYQEIVKDAPVVESNDAAGTCTLLVKSLDDTGHVVMNDDGTPKMAETRYDLSSCGISTIRR